MTMRDEGENLMTPAERLREVARILAGGILRLRARVALPASAAQLDSPKILGKIGVNTVASPPEARLNGTPG